MKTTPKFILLIAFLASLVGAANGQEHRRWQMKADGSISWKVGKDIPHQDHIEMSGKRISCVLRYGVNADSSFTATRSLVWPMLRTVPNNTHASLTRRFAQDGFDAATANGLPIQNEKTVSIALYGTAIVKSRARGELALTREFFPSAEKAAFCEIYSIKNTSKNSCSIEIPKSHQVYETDPARGTEGSYAIHMELVNSGHFTLKQGDSLSFSIIYYALKQNESLLPIRAEEERSKRLLSVREWQRNLVLETPDTVLNREFAFAKIRGAESIYETKGGPMHGPGGEAYYAAVWANDQAEYIGPFFPFLGYDYGNQASLNAYLHFAKFMNSDYKPIPSSVIAEGTDIWNGAGDRGDAAMIAYGAARYALASGDLTQAKQLWPLIKWCLEYCRRKLNADGAVSSDSDELEGRFPAGDANLCTSALYYDALNSAQYLAKIMNEGKKQAEAFKQQAVQLKKSIENFFGARIGGFDSYRYYKGNTDLRAWICIPLTMGIYERKSGTISALFSPGLWTQDGLASLAGDKTFWDRSTLYALRGVLAAGETDKAIPFLHHYSNRRLLGEHVPYPVEAYPEGGQRHLSAESGLYCRIFTEGLFGIRPTGLKSFSFIPRLPASWTQMKLKHIRAFQKDFSVEAERAGDKIRVTVRDQEKLFFTKLVKEGEELQVKWQ